VWQRDRSTCGGAAVSIDASVTSTLSELPAVMSDDIEIQVIDVDLMTSLSSSKTIIWCRTVRPLYPLRLRRNNFGNHCSTNAHHSPNHILLTTYMVAQKVSSDQCQYGLDFCHKSIIILYYKLVLNIRN